MDEMRKKTEKAPNEFVDRQWINIREEALTNGGLVL